MKRIFLFFSLLLGSVALVAQETLNLHQCRQMALKYNKEIAASAQQTLQARYMVKSFRGNFFPDIRVSGTGIYSNAAGGISFPGGNLPTFLPVQGGQFLPNNGFAYFPGIDIKYEVEDVYIAGVQLEQPLYMGGKIRAAYKMAQIGKEMALMNESLTATEVILKTSQAYAMVVKAQEMKKVADSYHAVLAELMKNVESACRHGLKSQNDVLKVQVKLNESELNIRKAQNALRLASMNLCHYIGKPLDSAIQVSDEFPEVNDEDAVRVTDITARPEYALLDKQVHMARQQIRLSRSEMLPKVGVKGAYNYMHGFKVNDQKLFDDGSFAVLLNVSVPIFHFGERHNKVRAAKAKLTQARLQQQSLNEQMLLELTQAANNYDEAQLQSRLAHRSLEQAEENMRVSGKQYAVGLETLSDYLEAQTLWQQAYEVLVDSRFQQYISFIAYQKAAGLLVAE